MKPKCRECNEIKPVSDYKHDTVAGKKYRRLSCRHCMNKRGYAQKKERFKNPIERAKRDVSNILQYIKRKEADSEAVNKYHREQMRKWRVGNKQKRNQKHAYANMVLNRAIKRGQIKKPKNCSECGSTRLIQGHHHDYSKPYDVKWLCQACHGKQHRKYDYDGLKKWQAEQTLIKAAKKWRKCWEDGDITQAKVSKGDFLDQDHPADTKLVNAIDSLLKLEKKS